MQLHYAVGGMLAAVRNSGTGAVTYLHSDHLGSVSLATTNSGSGPVVASEQLFTPWGQVRAGGIGQTTMNYTGQRLDGSGLLYYHARYYDPALARFVSADSVVPGAGALTATPHDATAQAAWAESDGGTVTPQALNRYSYVLNNPVNDTDSTGHCSEYGIGSVICPSGGGGGGLPSAPPKPATSPAKSSAPAPSSGKGSGSYGSGGGGGGGNYGNGGKAPDFVVTQNGEAIPVPAGATGPSPVKTGKGFQYTGGGTGAKGVADKGLDGRVSSVRIMDPTEAKGPSPGYPNGYVSYSNNASPKPQPVNPYTGQTLSRSEWHTPLRGPQ